MELKRNRLGWGGPEVTELCLGVLPMGPLQANLPPKQCISLISLALELGVNFLDTAEFYRTQSYVGEAVKGRRARVVIATKSMAATYDEMARSVELSLKELQTDYIDIYHLHAARHGDDVFELRRGALDCLVKMKEQKVVRSVGIATHNIQTVHKAALRDDIDIIFALINKKGLGITGGGAEEMAQAVTMASRRQKGVYAMKALAGGHLLPDLTAAMDWVRGVEGLNAVAVGMVSEEELHMDINYFLGRVPAPGRIREAIAKRLFIFDKLCKGCGCCVETCPNHALSIDEGLARVDHEKCLLCGYCGPNCPQFAIRVI